jgi:hypothetical protein
METSTRITVTMSLGKAHKHAETLRAAMAGGEGGARRRLAYFREEAPVAGAGVAKIGPAQATQPVGDVVAALEAQVDALRQAWIRRLVLRRDAATLKEAIVAANQRSSASVSLTELTVIGQDIADLEKLEAQVGQAGADRLFPKSLTADAVERWQRAVQATEGKEQAVPCFAMAPTEIAERLRQLRMQRNQVDDDLRQRNALTEITWECHTETAALLGLA